MMNDLYSPEAVDRLSAIRDALVKDIEAAGGSPREPMLPRQAVEGLYALAHAAYSVEDYAQAEALFQGMVLFASADPRGWLGLAGACEAQGKWADAVRGYAVVMGLNPNDPVAPFRSGVCLMSLGLPEQARGAFEAARAAGRTPGLAPALAAYGRQAGSMLKLLETRENKA
jgi:tetratricopeptide (TPR) repeat protein